MRHKSPMRLWWRRQAFYLRQWSSIKLILVFICILSLIIIIISNLFSAQYNQLSINQDAHWNNIDELLKIKEEVCLLKYFKKLNKLYILS
jgi:hypothetical protein